MDKDRTDEVRNELPAFIFSHVFQAASDAKRSLLNDTYSKYQTALPTYYIQGVPKLMISFDNKLLRHSGDGYAVYVALIQGVSRSICNLNISLSITSGHPVK